MANKKKKTVEKEDGCPAGRNRSVLRNLVLIALPIVLFFQIVFATRLFLSSIWVARGNAMRQTGRIVQTRQLFEHARAYDPNDYKTLHLLGAALVASGDNVQAADTLEQCLRLAPYHPLALDLLAIVYMQQGELDRASRTIERAERVVPISPYVHTTSGRILAKRGMYDQAVDEFRKAIELGYENKSELLRATADTYYRSGKIELAVETAAEAISADPDDPANYMVKGQLLAQARQWQKTVSTMEQGLAMLDKVPKSKSLDFRMRAYLELARAYTELDEPADAVVEVCKMQKLNVAAPQTPGLLDPISNRLEPDEPAYHLVQGWLLMQTLRLKEAAGALQQTIALLGQSGRPETEGAQVLKECAHFNLATVFLALGQLADAATQVFEVQKLDSTNLQIPVLIEEIAKQLDGDPEGLSVEEKAQAQLLLARSLVVSEQRVRGYETIRSVAENTEVSPRLRASAYAERARLFAGLEEKLTEALTELDRAEQIDPTLPVIAPMRRDILSYQRRISTQKQSQSGQP